MSSSSQYRLGFAKNLEALIKVALGLLFTFLHLGKHEAAERANAVGGIVQNYSKCSPKLLTVRVVRPVLGRNFREHHREEGTDCQ